MFTMMNTKHKQCTRISSERSKKLGTQKWKNIMLNPKLWTNQKECTEPKIVQHINPTPSCCSRDKCHPFGHHGQISSPNL